MTTYRLHFPADVTAEAVAGVLRVAAAESRGGFLYPKAPIVVETVLRRREVSWWISLDERRARHLQSAAETGLPGLRWEQTPRPTVPVARAIELRVNSQERLLDADLAEATVQRLLGVASSLGKNEVVLIQWQIGAWLPRSPIPPAAAPEPRTIWNLPEWGNPVRDSERVTALRKKQAEHIFAAVGRVAVGAATDQRADGLLASTINAYQLLRAPGVGVSRRRLPSWWVARRLDVWRVSQIGPAIRMTASELAGVIGWPVGNPALPGVRYAASRRLALDERCLTNRTKDSERILGAGGYPSQSEMSVRLGAKEGLRHLHVIGPSGVGKSTLLAHLILSDISAGRGVVAIDPKGDLVTEVLERVPESRRDSVIVLDPSDASPVGFNPLDTSALGIDGLLHVLRSIWATSWGPRMGDVIHAGLLTLSHGGGHSLPELPLLLTDAAFRRPLVARAVAEDPLGLGTFWPAFDALSDDARAQVLAPVMNKLRAFLLRPELRATLGQASPRFDLSDVFTQRRTLLVRLPKGQLGGEGAQLLGSLLVAHLWRLSLKRGALPANRRHPVFLYLDEFQEFLRLPLDLPDALVQARGLGVGLVLAHQHLGQLDAAVRSAMLANAGSRVAFHLDHDDAQVIAKRSGGRLRPEDLSGLGAYEAYASLLAENEATPYGSMVTLPLDRAIRPAEILLKQSRERWGVPASETEQRLRDLVAGTGGKAVDLGPLGGRPASGGSR